MGSLAPYGYTRYDTPNHTLVIDPEAAEVVRRIFEMRAIGMPYNSIVDEEKAKKVFLAHKSGQQAKQNTADTRQLRAAERRLTELDRLIHATYEDKVMGRVPEDMCISLLNDYQQEKENLQAELNDLIRRTEMAREDEQEVDEYIRRLKSYAGAEMLTRQMCMDLIEYITIDKYQGKKVPRDIHIYYKLIDKPLTDRKNAFA